MLALGVVLAARSWVVAVLATAYIAITLTAAIRTEEAFLRGAFGDAYDRYAEAQSAPANRPFSLERAAEEGGIPGLGRRGHRIRPPCLAASP